MKRVSTPCAVHADCILRVMTDDDGNDSGGALHILADLATPS